MNQQKLKVELTKLQKRLNKFVKRGCGGSADAHTMRLKIELLQKQIYEYGEE